MSQSPGEHALRMPGDMGRWAPVYDAAARLLFMGREQAIRRKAIELAQIRSGDKVLEVGCGTGTLTLAAKTQAGPTGEVYGIDIAPEMVDLARRKASQAGADLVFQVGSIEAIPFPDSHFDVVLNSFMIYNMPNEDLRRQGFAEMRRVLKPGGRLLVVDFELPTRPWLRRLATLLLRRHTTQADNHTLLSMMAEAGFTEIEMGQIELEVVSFMRGKK